MQKLPTDLESLNSVKQLVQLVYQGASFSEKNRLKLMRVKKGGSETREWYKVNVIFCNVCVYVCVSKQVQTKQW